jgi:23S rRNA (uracil1939-C5)-methyltransferase
MVQVGDRHVLSIVDVALPSGYGVARLEGMVIFVPGAVPGDRPLVRIFKLDKRFAYGEMMRLEENSPFRRQGSTELCPYHGECGGCGFQVLAYDKQLEIKQNHLEQVLQRIGGVDLSALSLSGIVPSVDQYYYRSKIEFAFGRDEYGTIVGLSERMSPLRFGGGSIVAVRDCRLFSPATGEILAFVRDVLKSPASAATGRMGGRVGLKRLVLREGKGTGEVMVNVISETAPQPPFSTMLKGLSEKLSSVRSIYLTLGDRPTLVGGRAYINEIFGGLTLRVYPLSFFQPNPKTAEVLCRRIVPLAGLTGNQTVIGLYCGAGTIELYLSSRAREVIGVDSSGESIACAKENGEINNIGNCTFRHEKVERMVGRYAERRPDVLVIDPPRAGMSREALAAVMKLYADRFIYISCNPSSLARDLKMLRPNYMPKAIVPFDFFPHTGHFEVVTLLERR